MVWNKQLFFWIWCVIFGLILLLFQFRGIIYTDEGFILNSALKVYNGEIPYRDFDAIYTPVSFVITSLFFHVFGVSVFAGRLTALFFSVATLYALYQILLVSISKKRNVVLSLIFFIAWGPSHINFPWPTMVALCFFSYAVWFVIRSIKGKNKWHFFLAGIGAAITFFSKQNFGVGIFILSLASFLYFLSRSDRVKIGYFLLGWGSVIVISVFFLSANGALYPFIQDLYINTWQKIIIEQSISTPFLYEGQIVSRVLKGVFYTVPLTVSIFVGIQLVKKQKKNVALVVCAAVVIFYFFGIRPTTDYTHFVPLLAFSSLVFGIGIEKIESRFKKNILLCGSLFLIGFGFYTAVFFPYYRWEKPLVFHSEFASFSKLGVFVTKEKLDEQIRMVDAISRYSKKGEYIYVHYYAPMVYFLSGRKNPSKYDYINIPDSYQRDTVHQLQMKKVGLVLLHTIHFDTYSFVGKYIQNNYCISEKVDDWYYLIPRAQCSA